MIRPTIVALALSSIAPAAARADFSLAVSVGSGWRLDPDSGRIPTNLMLAPGFDVAGELLRLEVGFVADLPDVRDTDFDVQLRPMLVLNLPPIPLYARLVTGVTKVLNGPLAIAFGAVAGLRAALGPETTAFVEAGFVPQAHGDAFESILEGRLGLTFGL